MPFQALPIAFNANPGSPLAKLVWIFVVDAATFEDAPNGKAMLRFELETLAAFAQCTQSEAAEALKQLERCGLLAPMFGDDRPSDTLYFDVNLPISDLRGDERRRIKASPDQISLLAARANYICRGCGRENVSDEGWHVDHIIPRSIGGADVEANCQVLCGSCNSRKGAKVHWVDFLGGRHG